MTLVAETPSLVGRETELGVGRIRKEACYWEEKAFFGFFFILTRKSFKIHLNYSLNFVFSLVGN